jgi:phenylacetate-CoA ligase
MIRFGLYKATLIIFNIDEKEDALLASSFLKKTMSKLTLDIGKSFEKENKLRKEITEKRLNFIYQKDSDYWKKVRESKLLELFHLSADKVKAYKDFLKKARINPSKIKTIEDFQNVLPINKDNYLRSYPWEKLCVPNSLVAQSLVLTSTSGSTGRPFYFPRNGALDAQSSIYHQMFLRNSGIDPKKSTLVLICFGMGVWIGGVITYQAFKAISERGYPMTILTPGVNKREIYEALKNIGPKYDQVILCGYPPFMKDVVDEGTINGVNWNNFNVKIVFAAEAFSEKFRDYIMKKTGMKDPYRDTMNIYGSADLGTMAEETPISILIRRLALKDKTLYKKIFSEASRLPTFAQYIPDFISFECVDKNVYCTGDNVLPLVRYAIGDNGGVHDFKDIEKIFKEQGMDLREEAKKAGIEDTIAELPFVYIYERTDLSTKLYGAIIYPEYIKAGLQNSTLEKYITGKFTMFTEHDKNEDEYLEINVELKSGINESEWLATEVRKYVSESLLEKSAEHKNNANMMADKVEPRIVFWPHEHPTHFQTGIKQKWVKKTQ